MNAIADVVEPDTPAHIPLGIVRYRPLPSRTPGQALAHALAEYPAVVLWDELRQILPPDAAKKMFDAAIAAALTAGN